MDRIVVLVTSLYGLGHNERNNSCFIKETNVYYQKKSNTSIKSDRRPTRPVSTLAVSSRPWHARDRHTVPRPGLIAGHHCRLVYQKSTVTVLYGVLVM